MRDFCIAGPVKPEIHYSIPALERIDREQLMGLIGTQNYFVLHAPRQTGKTSALMALADHLNSTGKYRALYVNIEGAQAARDDVEQGIRTVVLSMAERAAICSMTRSWRRWPLACSIWARATRSGRHCPLVRPEPPSDLPADRRD